MNTEQIAILAQALIEAEQQVEFAEMRLRGAKEKVRQLKEETIPCAMQELGLEKFTLTTGENVTIKNDVYASIPADQKPTAYAWLLNNGFGGLIKTEVTVSFGRGEKETAEKLAHELANKGLTTVISDDVHAQTLKAFLREQLANGSSIPLELFGARAVSVATVKAPTKKAAKSTT